MQPVSTIPLVEVFPLVQRGGPLRVVVSRVEPPVNSGAVDAAWARLVAANPRYFDGPLLSVLTLGMAGEGESNEVAVRRDRFSRLAVQPGVATGVRILSVTAVLLAKDDAGLEHVLLGRRGMATRIYGGMWELGPSGGLHVPPPSLDALDEPAIFSHLADEVSEEVGLQIEGGNPVGVVRDNFAMSDDIVYVCDVGSLGDVQERSGPANWEYSETAWVPLPEVGQFDRRFAAEIIQPTRALFRGLGWTGG